MKDVQMSSFNYLNQFLKKTVLPGKGWKVLKWIWKEVHEKEKSTIEKDAYERSGWRAQVTHTH